MVRLLSYMMGKGERRRLCANARSCPATTLCGPLRSCRLLTEGQSWSEMFGMGNWESSLTLEGLIGHLRGNEAKSSQAFFLFRGIVVNH